MPSFSTLGLPSSHKICLHLSLCLVLPSFSNLGRKNTEEPKVENHKLWTESLPAAKETHHNWAGMLAHAFWMVIFCLVPLLPKTTHRQLYKLWSIKQLNVKDKSPKGINVICSAGFNETLKRTWKVVLEIMNNFFFLKVLWNESNHYLGGIKFNLSPPPGIKNNSLLYLKLVQPKWWPNRIQFHKITTVKWKMMHVFKQHTSDAYSPKKV